MKVELTAKIDEFPNNSVIDVSNADFIRVIRFNNEWTAVDWDICVFHFHTVIAC